MHQLPLSRPPRALAHFEQALPHVLAGILLMAGLAAYLHDQSHALFGLWSQLFAAMAEASGLPASVTLSLRGEFLVNVSTGVTLMPAVESAAWGIVAAALLAAGSFALRLQNVPGRYGLRALALVVGAPALAYFVAGGAPAVDVSRHLAQVFKTGYWFLLATPAILAVTGFVLPGSVAKRAALAVLAVAYLAVTVPVLAVLHLHVLALGGVAWLPFLNIGLTILVLSFELVAFYGLVASVE